VANFVDRKMPHRLQTFLALYGSWVETLQAGPKEATRGSAIRRLVRLLLLDVTLLAALAIGTSVGMRSMAAYAERALGLSPSVAKAAIVGAAAVLALPLGLGVVRVARGLGVSIAAAAFPKPDGDSDLAATPRRALLVTLQLAIVLLLGLPLLALTQPILGGVYAPVLFVVLLLTLGIGFWRGATELEGHVHAGAHAIIEVLVSQARTGGTSATEAHKVPDNALNQVHQLLPGLGEPTPVELDATSPAVGKSLAQLNLRGVTGATVLAITRGVEGVLVPTASEVLRVGDILALAGTHEAIDSARALLTGGRQDDAIFRDEAAAS
jgi:CPA2 family monovalent cation:H+ antiporter-2